MAHVPRISRKHEPESDRCGPDRTGSGSDGRALVVRAGLGRHRTAYRRAMDISALLTEAFDRIDEGVQQILDGLEPDALAHRPDPEANSIAWLVWHTARIQDDQLADLVDREPIWHAARWQQRFALPLDADDTGYGHTSEQVDVLGGVSPELLSGYHDAVARQVDDDIDIIVEDDLDRVIDESWDPPVTAGVRLVSILDDAARHVGQAAYARGLYERSETRAGS